MKDLEYCIRNKKTHLRFHVNNQDDFEKLNDINVKEIIISGLNQKFFDYFCKNFAQKFEIIQFWKCNLIKDFTSFELLNKTHFIIIDWNNKATKLWNMSNNVQLKGLYFNNLMKVTALDGIEYAPSLTELHIEQGPDVKLFLETLTPLMDCNNLKKINIYISGILDGSAVPILKMKSLKEANFMNDLFETEQFAMMAAKLHDVVRPNKPYKICDHLDFESKVMVVGKKKPWLKINSKKLKQYEDEWNEYIEKYK
jgi:hypothetical protein